MHHGVGSFIPVRFLALIAHSVLLITMLWSRKSTLDTCLPPEYTTQQYNDMHETMTIGFALALALLGVEVLGFLFGVSMFVFGLAIISILAHCFGVVTLTLFILRAWSCQRYWYIFGFCSAVPAFFEIVAIVLFMLKKRR